MPDLEWETWVAIYGAIVATSVAVFDAWKSFTDRSPRLLAIVDEQDDGEHGGITAKVLIQNAGGRGTQVLSIQPRVLHRWCPKIMTRVLVALGRVPLQNEMNPPGLAAIFSRPKVELAAYDEAAMSVTLWPEHRAALRDKRLVLLCWHSKNRPKACALRVIEASSY